ncbi:MAG: DUF2238 domain-containing protein [Planctomycetota bacterium]|jgi:putative membrane protein|nr:DUF2238 domain-containing protein [Planctomycetota bacterium]
MTSSPPSVGWRRGDDRLWLIPSIIVITVWSYIGHLDFATWVFEIIVGLLFLCVLIAAYPRFRFARVIYIVALVHYLVLAIGGKYTYSESPVGAWMQDLLSLERNPFDRIGHFMQGFTPAIVVRELLLRRTLLHRGWALRWIIISISLAFSAFYELLEWWMVIFFYPDVGPEWLGHQGDPFDAQADMLMAILGALLAMVLLSGLQDRQMSSAGHFGLED